MRENLLTDVPVVNVDSEYWFVRTDSGDYFETFLQNDFIAIGWNEVTLQDLRTLPPERVKEKIYQILAREKADEPVQSTVTGTYTKLLRFLELKQGDKIVIPSKASETIGFGIIEDQRPYNEHENMRDCPWIKRRSVKWIRTSRLEDLDPIFYKIRMSRHAISSIKEYAPHIDRVIGSLFVRSGATHFVFNVDQPGNINFATLATFIHHLQILLDRLNEHFELNDPVTESTIKLNLQSRGKIELALRHGFSLALLAFILDYSAPEHSHEEGKTPIIELTEEEKTEADKFIEANSDTIQVLQEKLDELEVDRRKINSY